MRPELFPHESFNHSFVKDYYNGIFKKEAEKRISVMLNVYVDHINEKGETENKKWWQIWKSR